MTDATKGPGSDARLGVAEVSRGCFVCPQRVTRGASCWLVRLRGAPIRGQACPSHTAEEMREPFIRYARAEFQRLRKMATVGLIAEPQPDGSFRVTQDGGGDDPAVDAMVRYAVGLLTTPRQQG